MFPVYFLVLVLIPVLEATVVPALPVAEGARVLVLTVTPLAPAPLTT